MRHFDSILVANRGEIAVRVIRSARELGYRTIAVYSEADAQAPHVALADEAVLIGPAPVQSSYLHKDRILDAARRTGAEAIHPGYGFLAENADFADACHQAGMVFIGPSAEAIEVMGNKAASKRRMLEAGVPCVPGYQDEDQSDAALLVAADAIGVPLMVKAAAGGGGRGMRLVTDLDALPDALASARSEATNAFGSDELILEKALLEPRHVEFQVFGDTQGNVIHLGERDCSVQRRHQKVVEEAPCPVMTAELREAMGRAAVNAARSIDYVGAGTVEFLLDAGGNFYFLEMNTRLQVEHPVTEMITGLDLVALQFHVAQGYPLPLAQDDVILNGHAIEARLYAEDTANEFLPAAGLARVWAPADGDGIRVDHGLASGQTISPFYDPMVAKVIAWGEDRDIARRRLLRALEKTRLSGLPSNRAFLLDVLRREAFANGEATTAFIGEHYPDGSFSSTEPDHEHLLVGACLLYRAAQAAARNHALSRLPGTDGYSGLREVLSRYRFGEGEAAVDVLVDESSPGQYRVSCGEAQAHLVWLIDHGDTARVAIDGVQLTVHYDIPGRGEVQLQLRGLEVTLADALAPSTTGQSAGGSGAITAPMHGNIVAVLVAEGDSVAAGQDVAIIEAMKMEHRLSTPVAGQVSTVQAAAGDQVSSGDFLLEITPAEAG